jgi:GH24 family phage-related lysozyme (muramidase)
MASVAVTFGRSKHECYVIHRSKAIKDIMKTSEDGISFIKNAEGFTPIPKPDNGHLMWGFGHDQRGFEAIPDHISAVDADALLRRDLPLYFEPHVVALAPWANQNQFDALVDFCYNLGPGALATMLHHGENQVATQIAAWCYEHVKGVTQRSPGLASRRAKEIALYGS